MGNNCILLKGGGSGVGSDELTATLADVLKGKTVVASDTGDEIGTGTLELTGDATENYVLSGKTFYSTDAKTKLTGTLAVTSAINFSAAALSTSSIRISWTNPSAGPWEGVEIHMSTDDYPGVSGGSLVYSGAGNSSVAGGSNYVDITGLEFDTYYYFTCTSYALGLGNGSSYNVEAKTKGMLLYDNGDYYTSITAWNGTSEEDEYFYNNLAFHYLLFDEEPDISECTKFCITGYASGTAGTQSELKIGPSSDPTTYTFTKRISTRFTSKSSTLTFDISGYTGKTLGCMRFSSNGKYSDGDWTRSDVSSYITKMWLE